MEYSGIQWNTMDSSEGIRIIIEYNGTGWNIMEILSFFHNDLGLKLKFKRLEAPFRKFQKLYICHFTKYLPVWFSKSAHPSFQKSCVFSKSLP
jgi:hypothetical protein